MSTIMNNYTLMVSEVIIGVLIFLVLIFIKRTKVLQTKFTLNLLNVVEVVFGIAVFVLGIVGGYNLCRYYFPQDSSVIRGEEKSQPEEGNKVDNETQSKENIIDFVYGKTNLKLYAKQDKKSDIVYELNKNSSLIVIDQAAGWYRVMLTDNIDGWIEIKDLGKSMRL